jgi:hypothetical protein
MDSRLKAAFENRNLVFVVGTGVTAAVTKDSSVATWRGLINSGISLAESLDSAPGWASLIRSNLDFGFLNSNIGLITGAAGSVVDELKRRGEYVYTKWLADTVGALKTRDPGLTNALRALPFPILTTNYDTLLEDSVRISADWTDPSSMQALLAGNSKAIGHLHGVWSRPESVIFSDANYQDLLASQTAQAVQSAASTLKSLAYVGFGSGLQDSNFSHLIQWHRESFAPSGVHHFRFCLDGELADLQVQHADDHIIPIAYGKTYEDLIPFLASFVTADIELSKAGIARDVVADSQQALLNELKHESIIGEALDDIDNCALGDLILPPVLLPVPQADYVRSRVSKDPTARIQRLTAEEEVRGADVIVLAAEENGGLTTAVKWLALQAAMYLGAAAPIYLPFQKCRRVAKPLAEQLLLDAQARGLISRREDPIPPYVLALDDFTPYIDQISDRVIAEVAQTSAVFTVIGCAAGVEDEVVERLGRAGVKARVRYLGKLSAADIRTLARLASPTNYQTLAKQVVGLVRSENLPRTPFTVALLISLYLRGGSVSTNASQTSILDDYVGLLLGRGDPHDDSRFGLDQSQREAILAGLAQAFVDAETGGLTESEVIRAFQDQFDRFAWDESPTKVLTNFLDRRVLRREGRFITFARSSFLHLFAAKRAMADSAFRSALLKRPLFYTSALSDYAALYRHDSALLADLASLLRSDAWDDVRGGQFEPVGLTLPIRLRPIEEAPDELDSVPALGADDDLFDSSNDDDTPPFPISDEQDVPPGLQLIRTLDLVSKVLRDSDQIEDLSLKQSALLDTLRHWGVMMSVLNKDRSFKEFLREIFDQLKTDGMTSVAEEELLNELTKAMPASIAVTGISLTLASRKLIILLDRAIADGSVGASPEATVSAAFFLFVLKEPGWVAKLAELLRSHEQVWIVRNYLLYLLLKAYYDREVASAEGDGLLSLCLDIVQASTRYGHAQNAATHRDHLRSDFQARRLQNQMRIASGPHDSDDDE